MTTTTTTTTTSETSADAPLHRDELARYLDHYLDASAGKDYGPNGLQVQGKDEIRTLVTGVSACLELFERALDLEADAVLVHHGIFWDWLSPVLVGPHHERVRMLLEAEVNLYAYHLPLDRHLEVGNAALAARALGLEEIEPFGDAWGLPTGVRGRFPEPLAARELYRRCLSFYQREPVAFLDGPDPLESLGIISGGAQKDLPRAIDAGLDGFLTGEISEWCMNTAREAGIHFLSCGHHATERCGVRTLGENLGERFGLAVHFVDIPNPA